MKSIVVTCILLAGMASASVANAADNCVASISTQQKTEIAEATITIPQLNRDSSIGNFFSSAKELPWIIEAFGIDELTNRLAKAIDSKKVGIQYQLTKEKWDDMGLSRVITSNNSLSQKIMDGRIVYYIRNARNELQIYIEMMNQISGAREFYLVGNTKIRRGIGKWFDKQNIKLASHKPSKAPTEARSVRPRAIKFTGISALASQITNHKNSFGLIYRRSAEVGRDLTELMGKASSSAQVLKDEKAAFYLLPSHATRYSIFLGVETGLGTQTIYQITDVNSIAGLQKTFAEQYPTNKFLQSNTPLSSTDTIDVDKYGLPGLVQVTNDYLTAYKAMSGWSFENSDRIEIVKGANRLLLDLKRDEPESTSKSEESHIDQMIEATRKLYDESGIYSYEASEFSYFILSLDIPVSVMAKLIKAARSKISSEKLNYFLFLNGMLYNIKIQNFENKNIKLDEENWQQHFDHYAGIFERADNIDTDGGWFSDANTPFLFLYAMLNKDGFESSMQRANLAMTAIKKHIYSTKLAGVVLLVSKSLGIDGDVYAVETLAKNIDKLYDKSSSDEAGAIVLGDIHKRYGMSIQQVVDESNYLEKHAPRANYTTAAEAMYAGKKMKLNLSDVRHAMNELNDRLYSRTSIESQGIVDLFEAVKLRRTFNDVNSLDIITETVRESTHDLIEEMIEEASDSAITTAIMLSIVLNAN